LGKRLENQEKRKVMGFEVPEFEGAVECPMKDVKEKV
jgi:hypothetical protein